MVRPSRARLNEIDSRLSAEYGRPVWHSHGNPLDELISTVLSQHTSDLNTARAFASLKHRFSHWHEVVVAPTVDVADAIRMGGLSNVKAPRIQQILSAVHESVGDYSLKFLDELSVEDARDWLQRLPGVGPKTAACVLLFSLGHAIMPVDTHVYRVSRRLGLIADDISADAAHEALDVLIGPDRDATYALHMNLIQHGRTICKARRPTCEACPLCDLCPSSQA